MTKEKERRSLGGLLETMAGTSGGKRFRAVVKTRDVVGESAV
jgi:hypothetical protein